jgi:hypothetical protein
MPPPGTPCLKTRVRVQRAGVLRCNAIGVPGRCIVPRHRAWGFGLEPDGRAEAGEDRRIARAERGVDGLDVGGDVEPGRDLRVVEEFDARLVVASGVVRSVRWLR